MTDGKFKHDFIVACNANPMKQLAFQCVMDNMTEQKVDELFNGSWLDKIPEHFKLSFKTHYRDYAYAFPVKPKVR